MPPKTGGERRCSAPAGKCGRDGKRGPSCGARRGRRRAQPPRPCRPLRQKILAAPAAAAGREAGSVSSACRAARPGWKTWPLLRCPARPSAGAAASALPTAAPKDSCCTCRGGARTFCPRLPALGSKSGEQSEKPRTFVRGFFWRRRRDLNPRAGFPTYALSRGASSTS